MLLISRPRAVTTIWLTFALLLSLGCAGSQHAPSEQDPWEVFNRSIYSFNDTIDTYALKPVAKAYRYITPEFVQIGISNFLGNLGELLVVINDLFQLKIVQALSDTARFTINFTLGFLGFFDVASHMGLQENDEDFGQTLGYWGVGSGPYLVLPFFGPSTVRDSIGTVVDMQLNPLDDVFSSNGRRTIRVVSIVSVRANLLKVETVLDAAALGGDKYALIRDAWLLRRTNRVNDGKSAVYDDDGLDALDELDEFDEAL